MNCKKIQNDSSTIIDPKAQDLIKYDNWPTQIKVKLHINKTVVTPRLIGCFNYYKDNNRLRPNASKYLNLTYSIEKSFVSLLKNFTACKSCSELNLRIH